MGENQEAWYLWKHTQTQLRTSFAGVVGLDYTAMQQVAEVLGIALDLAMLHKIQVLEGLLLKEANRSSDK
jgi:phage related hypothetical protein (DUF1799)|nr:MAG TPA: protein of unknown function DUF1799 [Caudoviricetes sp.]